MRTCPHLESLESEIESRGVEIGAGGDSPYGSDLGVWFPVSCTFDELSIRTRLNIGPDISFEEYDGRVAGSDATWYCKQCKRALMGLHPRYAPAGTPRIK